MKVEAPNALRFVFQDDIYLLQTDKQIYANDTPLATKPKAETSQIVFNYWGENKKSFLILTNYPNHEFIADEHLIALQSVLSRIGYQRADVAILNTAKNTAEYNTIVAYFSPKTIVILGKEAIPQDIKPPQFNLIEKHPNLQTLYTFGFDAMMDNTANKKTFWEQMKTL